MPFLPLVASAVLVLFTFFVLPLNSFAGEPEGPSAPVSLEVVNGAEGRLRCQLVLAHFVTQDIAPVPPGGETVIVFDRDADEGVLIFRHVGGRSMALENVLCGLAGDWRATRADLDLADLRAGESVALRMVYGAAE
ncbi:MAG: hypothetical protein CMM31_03670 [Rhodospirillaceae bacterium]|nr:hypothetical protein [Rhodospirillaceae bacterium]